MEDQGDQFSRRAFIDRIGRLALGAWGSGTLAAPSLSYGQSPEPGQQKQAAKFRVAGVPIILNPLTVLEPELRLAEQFGLDWETLILSGSAASNLQAVISGQVDAAQVAPPAVAAYILRGAPIKMICGLTVGGFDIITRKSAGLKSLADVKGRAVITQGPGTLSDNVLRYLLKEHGLSYSDIRPIQISNYSDVVTALFVTKQVDAALASEPNVAQTQLQFPSEWQLLFDIGGYWKEKYGSLPPTARLVVSTKMIDEQPETLARVVRLVKELQRLYETDRPKVVQAFAKGLKLPPNIIDLALQRTAIEADPRVKGSVLELEMAKEAGSLPKVPSPQELFDLRFV